MVVRWYVGVFYFIYLFFLVLSADYFFILFILF